MLFFKSECERFGAHLSQQTLAIRGPPDGNGVTDVFHLHSATVYPTTALIVRRQDLFAAEHLESEQLVVHRSGTDSPLQFSIVYSPGCLPVPHWVQHWLHWLHQISFIGGCWAAVCIPLFSF